MTGSKSIKKSLSIIIILISAYTFINQFYLHENNKLISDKLNYIEKNTELVTQENINLQQSIEEKENKIKELSDSFVLNSSLPVNTNILRELETKKVYADDSDNIKEEIESKSEVASIEEITVKESNNSESVKVETYTTPKEITQNKNLHNILVYGVNSGLTDTLLVISINKATKKISLISIPRDYWDSYYRDKINRVYRRHGYDAFINSVESIVGIKIHNFIRVDFQSFINIVDHLGGVWIYNDKDILDKRYPSDDFKYETFELAKGYHQLDGKIALKYARTRHGDSDFYRAKRQQEVINGVYNALLRLDFTDINKILNIVRELIVYVKTDISIFEGLQILSDAKEYKLSLGNVINNPNHLYSDRNYNGEYILLPRDPSMTHIHNYVQEVIK